MANSKAKAAQKRRTRLAAAVADDGVPFSDATPVVAQTLSGQVAEALERRILEGDLKPGTRLPTEPELCAAFSVSRSVVRDAVQSLRAKGLVHIRQGHGTVVAEPSVGPLAEA